MIDEITIQRNQWFPIYGFGSVNNTIEKSEVLKRRQTDKIGNHINSISIASKINSNSIEDVKNSESIAASRKNDVILWNIYNETISLDEVEKFLFSFDDKKSTEYRKLLCFYDFKKYS